MSRTLPKRRAADQRSLLQLWKQQSPAKRTTFDQSESSEHEQNESATTSVRVREIIRGVSVELDFEREYV